MKIKNLITAAFASIPFEKSITKGTSKHSDSGETVNKAALRRLRRKNRRDVNSKNNGKNFRLNGGKTT